MGTTFSQSNIYFQNNPVWKVHVINYDGGGGGSGTDDMFNYYVNGDTIINSFNYVKIFRKGILTNFNPSGMPLSSTTYINPNPSFFLRSLSKQIYINHPGNTDDLLLYDYNLSIGDTVAQTEVNNSFPSPTIIAIDSISTPFGFLKRFQLSAGLGYLYEGAGSSGGLVEALEGMFLSGTNELNCYSINGTGYFPSSSPDCDLALGITENKANVNSFVFPNPFSDKTEIITGSIIHNGHLHIYNAQGEVVRYITFSGNKIRLERAELKGGIYFYRIDSKEELTQLGKFIIN